MTWMYGAGRPGKGRSPDFRSRATRSASGGGVQLAPRCRDLAGRRLGDHHHGRAQQPPVQRPGRRPGLHHAAGRDERRSPARPSPGAGWDRTAVPVGSSRLMPLRSRMARKLRSIAVQALAQPWRRSPARRRRAPAGCRGRGAGCRPPPPRPGRISARHTGASRSPRDAARARTLAFSASARIQRSFISASSASSSAMRAVAACITCSGVCGTRRARRLLFAGLGSVSCSSDQLCCVAHGADRVSGAMRCGRTADQMPATSAASASMPANR